ncbi:hypothetical protein FIBSPDRAFT_963316 [Athelia psychrophila]|uniref:Uncharacterized protein n=1 Tax=Athelia psychrophila TaxID=1759441 RepID=A0A165Z539_9AGAM|nr:hypothetical protein FIBSPDRAFT_963316 [Fibularhizoctonia sp. CBS 109695]
MSHGPRSSTMESDIADQHRSRHPSPDTSASTPGAPSPSSTVDRRPPLRAPITPYRLFNIALLLGLGIPKAVFSAKGQSVVAGDLDWAGALIAGFIWWESVNDLPWIQWFYHKDLSRPIFDFLKKNTSSLFVFQWFIVPVLTGMLGVTLPVTIVAFLVYDISFATCLICGAAVWVVYKQAVPSPATGYNKFFLKVMLGVCPMAIMVAWIAYEESFGTAIIFGVIWAPLCAQAVLPVTDYNKFVLKVMLGAGPLATMVAWIAYEELFVACIILNVILAPLSAQAVLPVTDYNKFVFKVIDRVYPLIILVGLIADEESFVPRIIYGLLGAVYVVLVVLPVKDRIKFSIPFVCSALHLPGWDEPSDEV